MPRKKKEEPADVPDESLSKELEVRELDDDIDSDTMAQSGLVLKMKGASWSDIARVVGYSSPMQAKNAVLRALGSAANDEESIEQMRKLQNKRGERLLLAVMPRALKEDDPNQLAYHARAMAVVQMISRLNGLDAAQQVQVTASDETIQQYVAHLATLAGYNTKVIEGDILDEGEKLEGDF